MIRANIAGQGFCEVEWRDGIITRVAKLSAEDASAPYCSPGFIDLQVNGYAGVDFTSTALTPEAVLSVLPPIRATGVTALCPTLITAPVDTLKRSFRTLETARRISPDFAASVPCYHLEGPYLSSGPSHGAHNPDLMHPPDWDEFAALQEAAGGRIGIVTMAPELPGAPGFIARATESGVVVAIGHTDAAPGDIDRAVEAGARLSTHLGNGCPEYIHRHRSPIWSQLADHRLSASLICDGFHLSREFLAVAARLKGPGKCILVTDDIHVTGLPPGTYELGGLPVQLEADGRVSSAANPGALAGSTLRMNRAIARFQQATESPLEAALHAATRNPAVFLGLAGMLRAGEAADITVFRAQPDELRIEGVYLAGIQRFGC
ncbi:MAG TPA: amidohydrolase family protein [Candidatus Limnocylindrales bacterium]|nr:amidohydrolase family protein [Candidatus Limnocylindrales bacterium]